jgi:S1-C subfamily serine protease
MDQDQFTATDVRKNLKNIWRFLLAATALSFWLPSAIADISDTIEQIKRSIVVVGTFKKTNSPQFVLRGTGFVVGRGNLVATNFHVLPDLIDPDAPALAVLIRTPQSEPQIRRASVVSRDKEHDLALIRIEGAALPALALRDSDSVREGQSIGFTGFPIGEALGFSPVTHRGMISSITPIVLPSRNSQQLNEKLVRQLKGGTFNIFQLDATAYPGNSGSPVFDIETAEVIAIINMVFIKGSHENALSSPSGISYAIPANHLRNLLSAIAQ